MDKQNSLRIIIIDDNIAIHQDFIKILATNRQPDELALLNAQLFGKQEPTDPLLPNFQIDTASQGQEGVECIKRALDEKNPYALAFVDVRMPPGWDGIETIKHIWELDKDIQVVICTAYSDYSWEETIEQLGQKENLLVLKKPFDNITVRQLTWALTKKWQLLQETRNYTQSLETRVKDRTQSLEQSLSVTRGTLESSADGVLVVDNAGKVIDYNNNVVEVWHVPQSVLDAKESDTLLTYISTQLEKPEEFLRLKNELVNKPDIVKVDKLKSKDRRVFEFYSQPYKLNNTISGRIWSFRDITQRALLEDQLEYQATHDLLTGLPNRVILNDRLRQAIAQSNRDNSKFGVLFFDLDRFKLINDSLSHAAGDVVLKAFAGRIEKVMREEDTFVRLGGDEFVAVIIALNNEANLGVVATKLLDSMLAPFLINGIDLSITSSIGIAIYPTDGNTADELLRNADSAMYRAKELGGRQFQYYTAELGQYSVARLELESDLRKAIINEEFFLAYQPQMELATQRIVATEALVRWNHPQKGIILPLEFIPLAEDTGLIVPIGNWVLRTACIENKKWQDMGLPKIRIAVNMASQQIRQPDIVNTVTTILQETGLEPQYLEIELTENVIIKNIEAVSVINQLKALGIHIALDDFGTGYSCLNYLRKIPIDRLKIDQSFIQNIDVNRGDEVIIQALIAMSHNLNFEVIAEGVESQKQLDFLKAKACGEVQGFYFSKPLDKKDLIIFLKDNAKKYGK